MCAVSKRSPRTLHRRAPCCTPSMHNRVARHTAVVAVDRHDRIVLDAMLLQPIQQPAQIEINPRDRAVVRSAEVAS